VVQKFFDKGNSEHKPFIIQKLMGNILQLSLNTFGCRVIQKAIDHASPNDTLVMIIGELTKNDGIAKCVTNINGNHVVQKLIEKATPYIIKNLIMSSFQNNVTDLARDIFGCRIVQKLLVSKIGKEERDNIVSKHILPHIKNLCQHEFGNYVIQHIMQNGSRQHKKTITEIVWSNIVEFSKNKFASNVVECCLKYGEQENRKKLFETIIINSHSDSKSPLVQMANNEYGNYVLQQMFNVGNEDERRSLYEHLEKVGIESLEQSSYGRYTLSRMQKKLPDKVGIRPN